MGRYDNSSDGIVKIVDIFKGKFGEVISSIDSLSPHADIQLFTKRELTKEEKQILEQRGLTIHSIGDNGGIVYHLNYRPENAYEPNNS